MKKMLASILFIIFCNSSFSQWQLSLTMQSGETIAGISSPTDNVIWTITNSFFVYTTINQGNSWKRIKCKGLAANIYLSQLYVLNDTTAFMGVNTGFTGVGPGIIYKTTDGGKNWQQVFTHVGNCEILIGMFDDKKGIMSCYFSSFDNSIPPGETLYYTINSGNTWNVDIKNPSTGRIQGLVVKDKQVAMVDYVNFYASENRGINFTTKDKLQHTSSPKYYLQSEDSNYAILNTDNNIDILVKRPGTHGWINAHIPPGVDVGFVTGIILDKNECWMTEALDNNKLSYSSDSAKTFTSSVPNANAGFQFLTKARTGKTLVGGTPSFLTGQIFINKRQTIIASKFSAQPDKIQISID